MRTLVGEFCKTEQSSTVSAMQNESSELISELYVLYIVWLFDERDAPD